MKTMNGATGVPGYAALIEATFQALKELGGSGKNNEINEKAAELLGLSLRRYFQSRILTVVASLRSIIDLHGREPY